MTMTTGTYNRKRVWLGGGLLLVVVILALGWFVVVSPVLTETASTRDQIESVRLQNSALAAKNASLKAANDDVAALRDSLAAALAELPADSGLPSFTRQLSGQATAHSVVLTSVVVGAAGTVTPAAPVAAVDGTTTTPAGTSTDGLMQIAVTVTASGLGGDLVGFLSDIQISGPRRALVTSTQLAPTDSAVTGPDAPSTLSLSLTVFSAPMTDDERAALEKLLSGS